MPSDKPKPPSPPKAATLAPPRTTAATSPPATTSLETTSPKEPRPCGCGQGIPAGVTVREVAPQKATDVPTIVPQVMQGQG